MNQDTNTHDNELARNKGLDLRLDGGRLLPCLDVFLLRTKRYRRCNKTQRVCDVRRICLERLTRLRSLDVPRISASDTFHSISDNFRARESCSGCSRMNPHDPIMKMLRGLGGGHARLSCPRRLNTVSVEAAATSDITATSST